MNQKGNQRHLTFQQRVEIEKGLTENKSFKEIARSIGKDPSTISKEVRLHAHTKERPDAKYSNPPCINRKNCKIICPDTRRHSHRHGAYEHRHPLLHRTQKPSRTTGNRWLHHSR